MLAIVAGLFGNDPNLSAYHPFFFHALPHGGCWEDVMEEKDKVKLGRYLLHEVVVRGCVAWDDNTNAHDASLQIAGITQGTDGPVGIMVRVSYLTEGGWRDGTTTRPLHVTSRIWPYMIPAEELLDRLLESWSCMPNKAASPERGMMFTKHRRDVVWELVSSGRHCVSRSFLLGLLIMLQCRMRTDRPDRSKVDPVAWDSFTDKVDKLVRYSLTFERNAYGIGID